MQLLGAGGRSDKGYPSLEVSGTFWKTRRRVQNQPGVTLPPPLDEDLGRVQLFSP